MKSGNSCWVPPISRPHIYLRIFLIYSITVVSLLLLITFFPQLGRLEDFYSTIWLILILVGLQIIIWPLLIKSILSLFHKISAAFMLIAFPLISLVIPTILLMIANWLSPGLEINGFGSAIIIAVFMGIVLLISSITFSADDESAIFRWILKRNTFALIAKEDIGKPGIIFLEIDGLSSQTLEDVMKIGKTPNMKR
jgi:uncharacterized membrane protein YvlD (DUF360 family)